MSNTYTYEVLVTPVQESNNTWVNKRLLVMKDCTPTTAELLANTWNYNLCPQDACYYQPYIDGDPIYRQHIITGKAYKQVFIVLYDAVTDEPFKWDIAAQVVTDVDFNRFLNVIFSTTGLTNRCFYYGLHFFNCTPDTGAFNTCVATKIGEGQTNEQAIFNCYSDICPGDLESLYSEPFEEVKCRDTVLVKGTYPNYDCNGNWYGQPTVGTNQFQLQFRVYGEIVQEDYGFTETLQNNNKKSSKQIASYRFRTPKIPPYVAQMLAAAWNSKALDIDDNVYRKTTSLKRNIEDGNMWLIDEIITLECDEISFTCT